MSEQARLSRHMDNTWWTPLYFVRTTSGVRPESVWMMRCRCGTKKEVLHRAYLKGKSLSCGCYRKALSRRGTNRLPIGESARNQLLLIYRRSAVKHGRTFLLTREDFLSFTSSDCHYCGTPPQQIISRQKYTGKGNGAYLYNGIDRIDSLRGYEPDNCVACCRMCNYAKSDMRQSDFLAWLAQVVRFRSSLNQGS